MNIEDRLREALGPLVSSEPPSDVVDRATQHLPKRTNRRVSGLLGTAIGLVALVAVSGLAVVSLPRVGPPPGSSKAPEPTVPAVALETTHPVLPTESVPTRSPESSRTPATSTPTPMTDEAVVEFVNPDGPNPADYPPDAYPFFETAYGLPTYGQLWLDDNQRDVHIALTGDIDTAIEVLRDGVPRGITIYFHIVEHSHAELCALRDAMFDDRDELMRHGIVLSSGGCGNAENRVNVGMSPLNAEAIAYMRAHYDGPIHYEHGGAWALEPYDPPVVDEVRLTAISKTDDLGLLTCGRRPFPAEALNGTPTDLNATGPEYGALRDALNIYVDVYGDLSGLGWILAEKDDYGATFIADRGDMWLEAPLFAGTAGWAPGTIDYCVLRPLTHDDGGTVDVYFDDAFPRPAADATEVHVLVHERACSSGSSPADRLLPPTASYDEESVTLTVRVRGLGGPATCPGNPRLPVTIQLPEPIGDRALIGVTAPPKY